MGSIICIDRGYKVQTWTDGKPGGVDQVFGEYLNLRVFGGIIQVDPRHQFVRHPSTWTALGSDGEVVYDPQSYDFIQQHGETGIRELQVTSFVGSGLAVLPPQPAEVTTDLMSGVNIKPATRLQAWGRELVLPF